MTHAPPPGQRMPAPLPGYPRPAPAPVAPGGRPLAEYGDRVLAFLVDYAILSAAYLVLLIPAFIYQVTVMDDVGARFADRFGDPGSQPTAGEIYAEMFRAVAPLFALYALVGLAMLAVYYVYRVEMMFRTGQTVGKRVMKIRVVPVDPAGTLTRGVAVRRWLVDSLGALLVPLLFWVDGLWQYWDRPYRQCLHDKVAGTTVVKAGR